MYGHWQQSDKQRAILYMAQPSKELGLFILCDKSDARTKWQHLETTVREGIYLVSSHLHCFQLCPQLCTRLFIIQNH